ncbi:hypothetical protein DINM_002126 [Dirofilaria immitis]|nr:hypothetical protein [Dirofilaria immitis]
MNSSWHHRTILSTKNKLDLLVVLERGTEAARFWQSWRQVIVWALPTLYFIFDILALHCAVCASDCSISSFPPSNRNFITQWLSALHFGDWTVQTPKNLFSPNYTRHNLSGSSIGSSFNNRKSESAFGDNALFIHSMPLIDHHSAYAERHSNHPVSLSAKVGSRTSPRSRPTSSIQTNKQLEEYFQKSPQNSELFQSAITSFSTSLGSLSFPHSDHIIGISQSFRLASSKNNSYEVGTAIYDDEQGKVASDENSVVSLVTGSRIMVTNKRISLSPIPLNLIDVGNELTSEDGKGVASDGTDVTRNADNDSITFRVNHNAAKRSPKKAEARKIEFRFTQPLIRRSESYERRRLSSLSPHSPSGNQFSSVIQLNGIESSPTGKQIPITSSEILNQMDADDFAVAEHNLRSWICQTILRPLITKIDEINAIFIKACFKKFLQHGPCEFHAHLHLKIGHSSVEALQTAASSKNDLLKSALPYVLPYLKTHEKQSYLIKRCRELSADVCEHGYSPTERAWGPHLPTDAQLIWSWFAVYMDARMRTNPLVNDIEMPFSSVFYLRKPAKPSPLQCMKKSFYIYQSSVHPPHFELVLDGGRERFEVDRGTKNLWRTILLFIQHIRLFNEGQLGDIKIDENGINLACVLE